MAEVKLYGYADKLSVRSGDQFNVMASLEAAEEFDAQLVRLIHGDQGAEGPGFIEQECECEANAHYPGHKQYTQLGNFVRIDDPDNRLAVCSGAITLWAFIYPTRLDAGRQVILGRWSRTEQRGYALGLNPGGMLEFWMGNGKRVDQSHCQVPVHPHCWYLVAASVDFDKKKVRLFQRCIRNRYQNRHSHAVHRDDECHQLESLQFRPENCTGGFLLAGAHDQTPLRGDFVSLLYNGKLDRCGVQHAALERDEIEKIATALCADTSNTLASWDTTAGYTDSGIGDTILDTGPHALHGTGLNHPVRAVTGVNWNGRDDCFRLAPEQYGGVHFHDDAVTDARWTPTFSVTVPEGLRPGVYAMRLRSGDAEDHVVFFVRASSPRARILMLMPTCSYLAYANEKLSLIGPVAQLISAHTPMHHADHLELYRHPEYGLSTYDHHSDDEGVCYSSYLRPMLTMRPRHRMATTSVAWQFPADLSVIYWLEQSGFEYDLITDEDLHRDGVDALKPYNVVLNATHAEYYSTRMFDATEEYLAGGGRVMYLSGNGYYWVVGFRENEPEVMEVRKLDAGSRAWQARPGEHHLASTGERSGMWRSRGRAPQKLLGTGFTSEGMDESKPFRRMPDSYDESVSWMFEGIENEEFGDFGLARGGASGIEIDRYDLSLGTPPHTMIVASSEGHSDNYPLVSEEINHNSAGRGGSEDYLVRADITYFTTRNNGAVWSPSSIAFGQALPVNNADNDLSRLTGNVLRAFAADGPLPGSQAHAGTTTWFNHGRQRQSFPDPATEVSPEHAQQVADKDLLYWHRFNRRLAGTIAQWVTPELIAEHRDNPRGQHSDRLQRVQRFLQRQPEAGYLCLEQLGSVHGYRVVQRGEQRGIAPQPLDSEVYDDIDSALHAVFLARLRCLQPFGAQA